MSKNKKKRSEKDINRVRNKSFNLRLTEDEFKKVSEKILKSKLNRTDFILKCIEDKDVIIIENLTETIIEIRRQGININQIARALNEYVNDLETKEYVYTNMENAIENFTIILYEAKESNKKVIDLLCEIKEKELE
ncbi:MAG: plasmid mobilization relaxosome protein MobC [Clostridia bacterium]|nr:plasmid mobilization relaxosome protein MobC [Clostridia bacterium]